MIYIWTLENSKGVNTNSTRTQGQNFGPRNGHCSGVLISIILQSEPYHFERLISVLILIYTRYKTVLAEGAISIQVMDNGNYKKCLPSMQQNHHIAETLWLFRCIMSATIFFVVRTDMLLEEFSTFHRQIDFQRKFDN